MNLKLPKLLLNCYLITMNYQPGLINCTILKTIASNNSNHLKDVYDLEMPCISSFSYAFGKIIPAFGKIRINMYTLIT